MQFTIPLLAIFGRFRLSGGFALNGENDGTFPAAIETAAWLHVDMSGGGAASEEIGPERFHETPRALSGAGLFAAVAKFYADE